MQRLLISQGAWAFEVLWQSGSAFGAGGQWRRHWQTSPWHESLGPWLKAANACAPGVISQVTSNEIPTSRRLNMGSVLDEV